MMKNISDLTECPHCGNDTYHRKERVSGRVNFHMSFDGEASSNEDLYTHLDHIIASKYAYCSDCGKRIALL
jgi:predicted RNA-binding Zn-ribbon protein involved in translation (DUF1610 family)